MVRLSAIIRSSRKRGVFEWEKKNRQDLQDDQDWKRKKTGYPVNPVYCLWPFSKRCPFRERIPGGRLRLSPGIGIHSRCCQCGACGPPLADRHVVFRATAWCRVRGVRDELIAIRGIWIGNLHPKNQPPFGRRFDLHRPPQQRNPFADSHKPVMLIGG